MGHQKVPFFTMNTYLSKYNFPLHISGDYYVYNSLSGGILKVSKKLFDFIVSQEGAVVDIGLFDDNLLQKLYESGIIYTGAVDYEYQLLKYIHNRDKYNDSYLALVMLPTLRCNLNCSYCYESSKSSLISNKKIESLKLFLKTQAQCRKSITIRWSGGEMLTQWGIIKELSAYIIEVCAKYNCVYEASAITNGTLLNPTIIDEMVAAKIRSVQITIDGAKAQHDAVRFELGGKKTFDRILKGVSLASQKLKVILRLNIDKRNIGNIEELFVILSNVSINKQNIQLFCRPVIASVARSPKDTLTEKEFFEAEKKLLALSEKYEIPYSFSWGTAGGHVRCAYNCLQGIYVSPELKLYKCPLYIDQNESEKSIGYINDLGEMVITDFGEYNKSLSYSPFEVGECVNCKVLPICHGKCPILWEKSGRKMGEGCIPDKISIETKISYAIKNKIQMNAYVKSGIL